MRHSATRSLLERDDVIIVASVSCIYGIGSVETYSVMVFGLKKGETVDQRDIIRKLVALQYKRNDQAFRWEVHTSELQSLMRISYVVSCLKTKLQHLNDRRSESDTN